MNKRRRTIFISIAVVFVCGLAVAVLWPQTESTPRCDICKKEKHFRLSHLLPFSQRACQNKSMHACMANLRQIDGAKATWELEKRKLGTNTPTPSDLFVTNDFIVDWPDMPTLRQPGHTL